MIFSDLPAHVDHVGRNADGVAAVIAAAGEHTTDVLREIGEG